MNNFDDMQKLGKTGFDASIKSFGEVNKGMQAVATEVSGYSKKAFEDGTAVFEKLLGVRTLDQAVEIQTEYAKQAYEDYVTGLTKIGELYTGLAKDAYKPVEKAISKNAR